MRLKGKKVLVLGGAGFIGSALVRGLLKEGANVIVYDNFSFGHLANLKEIEGQITIINGDILNKEHLVESFKENEIEVVFHLVADPYVPNSYRDPDGVFNLITKGTENVANACVEASVEKILYLSSAEIYGNFKYLPIDERHPPNPLSVYAKAKMEAEKLCASFNEKHGIPLTTVRLFNAFGPRETHPYIIPELISQLSKSNVIHLGNLESRRSFIFVDDAAGGMIEIVKRAPNGELLNLGTERSYSVRELAFIIGKMFRHGDVKIIVDRQRQRDSDPKALECDYSKVRKLIGWQPTTSFESGLEKTRKWFLQNGSRWIWEETYSKLESVKTAI